MNTVSEPSNGFLLASAVGLIAGNVLAVVAPLAGDAPQAFVGSLVASGLFGFVFTVRTLQLLRSTGAVSLAAATLSTIFGGWYMIAPLLYGTETVGFVATAGTQFAGLVVAAFGLYLVVDGLTTTAQ